MDVKVVSNIDIKNYGNRGHKNASEESLLLRKLEVGQAAIFPKKSYTAKMVMGYAYGANEHFKRSRRFSFRTADDHFAVFRSL